MGLLSLAGDVYDACAADVQAVAGYVAPAAQAVGRGLSRCKTLIVGGAATATVAVASAQQQFDGFISQDATTGDISTDPTVLTDWLMGILVAAVTGAVSLIALWIGARFLFTAIKRFSK